MANDLAVASEPPGEASETRADRPEIPADDVLVEELLVEEVSIDGMCGVY